MFGNFLGCSLQRTLLDQILTAKKVFDYCKEEVKGVHVFFISTEDMVPVRSMLDARFQKVCTLPSTRSFHQFVPLFESVMAAKRVSEDQLYGIEFNLVLGKKNTVNLTKDPKVSDFVVCSYDEEYWIGLMMKWMKSIMMLKPNFCIQATQQDPLPDQREMTHVLFQL